MPLEGYRYYKEITINNTVSELTDYQKKFVIHRSDGTDVTGEYPELYIGEHCEADYDDIRFTTDDGVTLCNYWIQTSDSNESTIWVEIPTITGTGDTTLYLYYGNSTATAISSIANTMECNYESKTSEYALTISETPPFVIICKIKPTADSHEIYAGVVDTYIEGSPGYTISFSNQIALFGSKSSSNDMAGVGSPSNGKSYLYTGSAWASGADHIFELRCDQSDGKGKCRVYVDGTYINYVNSSPNGECTSLVFLPVAGTGEVTYCAVAKYSHTPPTISSIGSEVDEYESNIIGKYTIELTPTESDIIGKYDVCSSDTLIGKYTITLVPSESNIIGKYSITPKRGVISGEKIAGTWSNYVIEIFDPVLTEGEYNKLKIRRRLNQIHTCEFDVINPSSEIIAQLIYNAPIRIRANNNLIFTGLLKRIEKQDNIPIYNLYCEGAAAVLRDITINETKEYAGYGSYYIIDDLLLPATNWQNLTSNWHDIDYTITPGNALDHIVNICKLEGLDWDVRQQSSYRHITDISGSDLTVDGDVIEDNYYTGRYGIYDNGSGVNTGFDITAQTGNVLTVSTIPTGVATGDAVTLWGKWLFYADRYDGSAATVEHYVVNKNCYSLNRMKNTDAVITSIVGVGQNPEIARSISWATACTFNYATLDTTESFLTKNASGTLDQYFWVYDTTSYPAPGVVQIGDEKIYYYNKSSTGFGTCDRGYDSTTAATHYYGDDILICSQLTFESVATTFPATGSFWIGTERIHYDSYYGDTFYDLTRGYAGSEKYRHTDGAIAFDAQYTGSDPEALTPVGLYGVQMKRISVVGATTKDALDKRIQGELLKNCNLIEYGNFRLLSSDFWKEVNLGDNIKFTDAAGTDHTWRIVGVDYEQYKPVTVYFGMSDNYILEDFANINSVSNSAVEKNQNARVGTVTELSSDGKMAKVTYEDDGTSEWVRVP